MGTQTADVNAALSCLLREVIMSIASIWVIVFMAGTPPLEHPSAMFAYMTEARCKEALNTSNRVLEKNHQFKAGWCAPVTVLE